ncbi:MAG: HAMP domain-containing histidine kinase [Deltaproteobacteria bacterium]|nr:HAMP domain-containing histidine kinase [Deltaproteobacteria bacterium]
MSAKPPLTEDATAILALAAHELKNALGGIGVALARCEQRLQAGKAITADDIGVARAEVRRLSALVNDLLDGARVDLGDVHVQVAPLDVAALAREVVEMFRAARGRLVTLDLPPQPLMIDADSERLRGVLINYLENAVKYAPEPAAISVSVKSTASNGPVRISVSDEGPGIQPEDQARLFQRFFRAPTVARRTQGLGLGLYLCRAIAEAHGGTAGVDSTPGAGATFWVEVPRGT